MEEKHPFVGIVLRVKSVDQPYLIHAPVTDQKFHLQTDLKLNLEVGDRIGGEYIQRTLDRKLESKPLLILSQNPADIERYLDEALKWNIKQDRARKNKVMMLLRIFQEHFRKDNLLDSLGELIDNRLQELADGYRKTYQAGLLESILDGREIMSVMKWWYKHRIMRYLEHYSIDFKTVQAIEKSALEIVKIIKKNPYTIPQLDIRIADEIVSICGIQLAPEHRKCGEILRYVYIQTREHGWSYLPLDLFLQIYPDFYDFKDLLLSQYNLYLDEDRLYITIDFDCEEDVSNYLRRNRGISFIDPEESNEFLKKEAEKAYLSFDQLDALKTILENQVSIVTGPAGSGKTSLLETLVPHLLAQGYSCVFVSFTGKAVSRLREKLRKFVDDDMICTIHWYISHYTAATQPDFVFVDEASMVGMHLFNRLIQLLKHRHHICFIGDPYQLDPINDFNLLSRLIRSELPHARLVKIHRISGETSGIYLNGQELRIAAQNNQKEVEVKDYPDFNMIPQPLEKMKDLIYKMLDGGLSADKMVILSPYNKSLNVLNDIFRRRNPNEYIKDLIKRFDGPREWKVGDRVMMTENCYDIGVMNGEEGKIEKYDDKNKTFIINFGNNRVHPFFLHDQKHYYDEYNGSRDTIDKDNLTMRYIIPSYAQTIHKSQGSEWDIVFIYMPLSDNSNAFLNRSLLYTAITRARKLLFVFGSIGTFKEGVKILPGIKFLYLEQRIDKVVKVVVPESYADMLKAFGIVTKSEWYAWIKKNHPDKNKESNEEDVKKVLALGKIVFS